MQTSVLGICNTQNHCQTLLQIQSYIVIPVTSSVSETVESFHHSTRSPSQTPAALSLLVLQSAATGHPRCQFPIKLYRRFMTSFYHPIGPADIDIACSRNRVPSSLSTTRDQHCEDGHSSQAKRHPNAGAHVYRGQAAIEGHKGLPGRRKDVRRALDPFNSCMLIIFPSGSCSVLRRTWKSGCCQKRRG